ncbi:hypothetical protein ES705_07203 [subsurface metagenome]
MTLELKKPGVSPPEKIIVTDYKQVNSSSGWDILLRCPNSAGHNNNDNHWSCRGNSAEERVKCPVCGFAAVFWDKDKTHKKGKSYKRKSSKKYLQEAEDKEIKDGISTAIDVDIENWSGYDDIIKEEVRIRLPYDLCFIPESERGLVMGAIVKAGIFRITELRDRVKKVSNLLKKQKESVKDGKEEKEEKGPKLKTFLPGQIHLVNDDGVKKYLFKNEDNKLSVAETWTGEGGQIYKPRQDIPIGYASPAVLTLDQDITWPSLLKDIERYIKKHLELPSKIYYLIFGLWIMHTYLIEETDITPYLYFVGLKGTGKSRAGQIANKLAYKCLLETMPTAPVLFRSSELWHNALVIDEAKFWGSDMDRDLARIVMSRYKRGVTVIRVCMEKLKGGEKQVEIFDVFGPLIICTESNIPEPIEDRSIKFQMKMNISPEVEDDWDETTEQALRDLLTLFRARFINKGLPTHGRIARRRLNEILSPLYKILLLVDESRKEEFEEFVETVKTSRVADEATSENATIISIFIDLYNEGKDYILTVDIAKIYNQDVENPNFQIGEKSMGWKIKPFNFIKKSLYIGSRSKAGWIIDRKTLIELAERFSIDTKIIPIVKHVEKVKEEVQLSIPD